MTASFLEARGEVLDHPMRECDGCGAEGHVGECGPDDAPTMLGYACGCLLAFSDATTQGWTFRGVATWAKQRREGGR